MFAGHFSSRLSFEENGTPPQFRLVGESGVSDWVMLLNFAVSVWLYKLRNVRFWKVARLNL